MIKPLAHKADIWYDSVHSGSGDSCMYKACWFVVN